MRRSSGLRSFLPVLGSLLVLALALSPSRGQELPGVPASEGPTAKPQAEATKGDAKKTDPESAAASKPTLSKEMTELRDRVRQAVGVGYRLPFNTRDNTPGEIMDFCLAYGCLAEVADGASAQKLNGVGALCWNYPCRGYQLFLFDDGRFMPRVGYGLQRQPSEFLAFLALSMVNADYELHADKHRGTVADLVDYEKSSCQSGGNLSFKLIGLSYYVPEGETWQTKSGEKWSVERLVREELRRSPDLSTSDATNRLMALSFAVHRRIKRKQPVDGPFRKAQEHVSDYHQYALNLQNPDGSWNGEFFAMKGASNDLAASLRSTGHIAEWLVYSLPDDRLQDPQVLRSVAYLAQVLNSRGSGWNLGMMAPRDIDAVMHATLALSTYDQRVFRPFDPETPSEDAKKAAKNASLQVPDRPNPYAAKTSSGS